MLSTARRGATQTTDDGAFAESLRDLLPLAGVREPVELHRQAKGAGARIALAPSGEGFVVSYGARLDTASPQLRRWVAAHELAHAHLGHTDPREPAHRVPLVLALASLSSFFLTALVLIGAVRPNTFGELTFCLTIAAIPLCVSMVAAIAVGAALQLPKEIAADSWATDVAGPLDDSDRDWKARREGRGNRVPRRPGRAPLYERCPMWARTHPRWRDRGRQVATVKTASRQPRTHP